MEKKEILKNLELIKDKIHERRVVDCIRILNEMIKELKLEEENEKT